MTNEVRWRWGLVHTASWDSVAAGVRVWEGRRGIDSAYKCGKWQCDVWSSEVRFVCCQVRAVKGRFLTDAFAGSRASSSLSLSTLSLSVFVLLYVCPPNTKNWKKEKKKKKSVYSTLSTSVNQLLISLMQCGYYPVWWQWRKRQMRDSNVNIYLASFLFPWISFSLPTFQTWTLEILCKAMFET